MTKCWPLGLRMFGSFLKFYLFCFEIFPKSASIAFQVKSSLWWFSNMVVLGGIMAYAKVRQVEMKNNTPEKAVTKIIENTKDDSTEGTENHA